MKEHPDLQWFNYTDFLGYEYEFSPVFSKEWLLRLLDLQKQLENIVSEDGVTLDDVCNKPLSPQV